jgi:hypothetical protein
MTYDQCQAALEEIRRRQGTDRPLVRVVAGGCIVRGRVIRGLPGRRNPKSPYAILVVEHPGLASGPDSFVQIATIPEDGLSGLEAL